jgi:hypothetical protein
MALRFNGLRWPLLLVVSISASAGAAKAWSADNEKSKFDVKPATTYPHHQTSEKVTVAVEPMETDEQTREAFGKVNPFRYGVLPVLLVIQNDGPDAIKVDRLQFSYTLPDGKRVDATPAQDVKFIHGTSAPKQLPGPTLGIPIKRQPKNPLAEWEIEGRAFAAKMVPAGQSASGFVYFQVPQTSAAASVYVSGLTDPVTGKELYYFEIPMSGN